MYALLTSLLNHYIIKIPPHVFNNFNNMPRYGIFHRSGNCPQRSSFASSPQMADSIGISIFLSDHSNHRMFSSNKWNDPIIVCFGLWNYSDIRISKLQLIKFWIEIFRSIQIKKCQCWRELSCETQRKRNITLLSAAKMWTGRITEWLVWFRRPRLS